MYRLPGGLTHVFSFVPFPLVCSSALKMKIVLGLSNFSSHCADSIMVVDMVFSWTRIKELSELRKVVTENRLYSPFFVSIYLTLASVNYFIFSEFISQYIYHFCSAVSKKFFITFIHSSQNFSLSLMFTPTLSIEETTSLPK